METDINIRKINLVKKVLEFIPNNNYNQLERALARFQKIEIQLALAKI